MLDNIVMTDSEKAELMEILADDFNSVLIANSEGRISDLAAFLEAVDRLDGYLRSRSFHYREPDLETYAFRTLAFRLIGKKAKTLSERYERGCIIEGLIRYGCPKAQAIAASGEWLSVKSDTILETAHNHYLENCTADRSDMERFLFIEHQHILDFSAKAKSLFPEKFPKATPAFNHLIEACKAITKENSSSKGAKLYSVRPYGYKRFSAHKKVE